MREWIARLFDWLRRDRLDAELAQELEFHRAHLERDARAAGGTAADAPSIASRQLGNVTRVREAARERWSVPWLDHLQQDIRYALRGLRRSPGFATSAIVTLALGIGANVAMFGVIDRLMFRPLPYLRDPAHVHRVYLETTNRDRQETLDAMAYTRYRDFRRETSSSFSQSAAIYEAGVAVGSGDAAQERPIEAVSASFFDFFDARPALGRYFVAAEDTTPVGASVVVLGYGFWQSAFGGRNVLGQPLQVGNVVCTIIGVTPRGFTGFAESQAPVAYIPITTLAGHQSGVDAKEYFVNYSWGWTGMMVRRRPNVTVAQANADLTKAYVRSRDAERAMYPTLPSTEAAQPRAIVSSMRSAAGPDPGLEARTLLWVSGVAGIVLLIACANVANLFLARAIRRRREVALRVALGVSRARIVAQALTESMVLSLLGSLAGIAIAQWGGLALRRLFVAETSRVDLVTDVRTMTVALGAALLAGIVTGIAPLLFARPGDLVSTLKSGPREGTYHRSRARSILLVVQGALSMALLVAAALFVRSLDHVRTMRIGYDADRVLIAVQRLHGIELSDSDRTQLGRRLLETAQAVPGVERATWVSTIPFWITSTTDFRVPGVDSVRRLGEFTYQEATADYFPTMGTRILRGRGFTRDDRANSPRIVVVSESMAKVIWRGQDALGKCMRFGSDTAPCTTVVGIAEDVAHNSLVEEQHYRYYLPIEQFRVQFGTAVLLRMRDDPTLAVERVRVALQRVMPGQAYVSVRPMRDLIDDEQRSWRVGATMFVAFGVLALAVAAIGLYGVIAYNVAQRMQELGVRVALGARDSDIVRLVVGQGVRFAVAGLTFGTVLAVIAARWVQPLLFKQSATDPLVFGAVGSVLVLVAVVASSIPARRATRVDPNTVLRTD